MALHPSLEIALLLATLFLLLGGMILLLDGIWRAEDHFDHYLKITALAFGIFFLEKAFILLGFENFATWPLITRLMDVTVAAFFLWAQFELFLIIRRLSGEGQE